MQPYTPEQKALLTGPNIAWGYGAELLQSDLTLIEDISAGRISACTVSRDCTARVHGSLDIILTDDVAPTERLRPYLTASNGVTSARFTMGAYVPGSPKVRYGTTPVSREILGLDALSLLDKPLPQPWITAPGAVVVAELRRLLVASGVTVPLLLDGSGSTATWAAGNTWPTAGNAKLDVFNGLLSAIGYGGVWADWDGQLRAGPFVPANQRVPEWAFVVGDPLLGTLTDTPEVANPINETPNQWIYVMNGITGDPVDGVSRLTIDNLDTGPSSQNALGYINQAPTVGVDAVDYPALVTYGNADSAAQIRATETITTTGRKLPVSWHNDIATYLLPALGDIRTVQGTKWSIVLHDLSMQTTTWETVAA